MLFQLSWQKVLEMQFLIINHNCDIFNLTFLKIANKIANIFLTPTSYQSLDSNQHFIVTLSSTWTSNLYPSITQEAAAVISLSPEKQNVLEIFDKMILWRHCRLGAIGTLRLPPSFCVNRLENADYEVSVSLPNSLAAAGLPSPSSQGQQTQPHPQPSVRLKVMQQRCCAALSTGLSRCTQRWSTCSTL